jgi:hypothetical protein
MLHSVVRKELHPISSYGFTLNNDAMVLENTLNIMHCKVIFQKALILFSKNCKRHAKHLNIIHTVAVEVKTNYYTVSED